MLRRTEGASCQQRSSGRTPAARLEERDRHVLDIAERLFLDKGYHQVSLALVATTAGVATRTIYARFGEKRALLDEVVGRRRDASELALRVLATEPMPSDRVLQRLVMHAIEHDMAPGVALLHADLLGERDPSTPVFRQWHQEGRWRTMLEQALAPAPAGLGDLLVACLIKKRQAIAALCGWQVASKAAIERIANGVVADFALLVEALGWPIVGLPLECCAAIRRTSCPRLQAGDEFHDAA